MQSTLVLFAIALFAVSAQALKSQPLVIGVCPDGIHTLHTLPGVDAKGLVVLPLNHELSTKLLILCESVFKVNVHQSAFLFRAKDFSATKWAGVNGVDLHFVADTEFVVAVIPDVLLEEFGHVLGDRELLRPIHRVFRTHSKPFVTKSLATKQEVVNSMSESDYNLILEQITGVRSIVVDGRTVTVKTRYTNTQDNRDAATFMYNYLKGLYSNTNYQYFTYGGQRTSNIISIKPGTTNHEEIIIIGAHYDSTSNQASTNAPGAVDNGSGAAAVMLVAKAFANVTTTRTVYFMLFGAEEQGLVGSEYFVDNSADALNIVGVFTMDMIAYSNKFLGVLIEGTQDAAIRELMDNFESNIKTFAPSLTTEKTYYSYGSDHVPFQRAGIPAFLAIEQDNTDYPGYHRTTDTISYVNSEQAISIARGMAGSIFDYSGAF